MPCTTALLTFSLLLAVADGFGIEYQPQQKPKKSPDLPTNFFEGLGDEDGVEEEEEEELESEPHQKPKQNPAAAVPAKAVPAAEEPAASFPVAAVPAAAVPVAETLANFSEGLDDEDSVEEEIDDLIGRLGKFRERTEKAQTSKSEEAVMARFFQGLDDDDEDGVVSLTPDNMGSAIMQLLVTGKIPKALQGLVEVQTEPAVEPIEPTGGVKGSSDSDTPASGKQEVDPPAVITTYHDLHPSVSQESKEPAPEEENPIVLLSRFNFHNNVMSNRDDEVEHWVIRFCHDWYSPCERMLPAYKDLARKSEQQLNQDFTSLKTTVRFAEIDCSTDKPLCNEQGAEMFPRLIHYHRSLQVSSWQAESGGNERDVKAMNAWMQREIKSILKSTSSAQIKVQDAIKPLVNLESSLMLSCASMIVTLLAHVWLIHAKSRGTQSENKVEDTLKDEKKVIIKQAAAPGPSGLASMLPEEWVSKVSGKQLLEL